MSGGTVARNLSGLVRRRQRENKGVPLQLSDSQHAYGDKYAAKSAFDFSFAHNGRNTGR